MHRERRINRRQQGDLGEASAIEWLTRQGAVVSAPLGHSPDYDLVAEIQGQVLRVQVKTSTVIENTPNGHPRYPVHIATNGGNQSWTGVAKRFDPSRFELLFALVGDGRRWLIPSRHIDAETSIRLGGPMYSEFEIESGGAIDELVYGGEAGPIKSASEQGERRSRRAGPVCKIGAIALSEFDSHLPHRPASPGTPPRFKPSKYERSLGKSGRALINQKRRVTLPQESLLESGLCDGDLVSARADGLGRIVLEKVGLPVWAEPD